MIQFNLLPDIKLTTIKSERLKRTVIVVCGLAGGICLLILIILYLTIDIAQKNHLVSLNKQVITGASALQNTPNLNQILKVQAQINALPSLHGDKPVTSRLSQFLAQLTPSSVTISNLNINFTTDNVTIIGAADSVATINTYVDTLKFSTFQTSSTSPAQTAFPSVILSTFAYQTPSSATYTITATFSPDLFSSNYNVTLTVPTKITTRSQLNQPQILFQPQTTGSGSTNQTTTQ